MKTRYLFLLLFFGLAVGAHADTLKLKNGTAIEGSIVAETDAEYTVEQSRAGGSIKTKETIRKSDVAEVVRATAEQKAAQVMKLAYDATQRYKIDPKKSYPKDYYDKVIELSFRKFLADYPQSPYKKEMEERIAVWEAEREKVLAGQVKRDGQWVSAEVVAATEGTQQLQEIRAAFLNNRYAEAAQGVEKFISGDATENLKATAKELREKVYQQWLQTLQQTQVQLGQQSSACTTNLVAAKDKLDKAQDALRKASAKAGGGFKTTESTGGKSSGKMGGASPKMGALSDAVTADMHAVAAAQKVVTALERQQLELNAQLVSLNQTLPKVQARVAELGVVTLALATTPPTTTTVVVQVEQPSPSTPTTVVAQVERPSTPPSPPAPPSKPYEPEEEGGLLSKIAGFAKKYWLYALVLFLAVLWFVSRKLGE